MTLGVLAILAGLLVAGSLLRQWREQRAFQARLDVERAETQRRHIEDELRRRMRDSYSEWPWPPRGDE